MWDACRKLPARATERLLKPFAKTPVSFLWQWQFWTWSRFGPSHWNPVNSCLHGGRSWVTAEGGFRVGIVGSKRGCSQLCWPSPGWLIVQGLCTQGAEARKTLSVGMSCPESATTWELSSAFSVLVSAFLSCLLLHFFLLPRLSFLSPRCCLGWVAVR